MAKTWTEKLNAPADPVIKPAPVTIAGMRAGEIMLVPTARLIEAFIRALHPGEAIDVKTMRKRLATRHGAEVTCPIYTGYHLRTVAEAACEALRQGTPIGEVTPFWRVIGSRSPTAGRLPCGIDFIVERRREEGLAPS